MRLFYFPFLHPFFLPSISSTLVRALRVFHRFLGLFRPSFVLSRLKFVLFLDLSLFISLPFFPAMRNLSSVFAIQVPRLPLLSLRALLLFLKSVRCVARIFSVAERQRKRKKGELPRPIFRRALNRARKSRFSRDFAEASGITKSRSFLSFSLPDFLSVSSFLSPLLVNCLYET